MVGKLTLIKSGKCPNVSFTSIWLLIESEVACCVSRHGFKNRTGHQTFFFLISGSTPVFARFLTGFEGFNPTRLTPGSQLNRPVRSGF